MGPLVESDNTVTGISNSPIKVKGVTKSLQLNWDGTESYLQLTVLGTLKDVDVILGMDVLSRLDVTVEARSGRAQPRQADQTWIFSILEENLKVPAGKSRVFFLRNEIPGLVLFEPSVNLPEGLSGVPTLGEGSRVAVQLENHSDQDVKLSSQWQIGKFFSVQLVVKEPPKTGQQIPEIPEGLSKQQKRQLQDLLNKFPDVFSKKGDPISSTPLIEHEIHTTGPAIRLPSRRQNPLVREQEQEQIQDMLRAHYMVEHTEGWGLMNMSLHSNRLPYL